MRVCGLEMQGLGFRIWGFSSEGLELRVLDLRFRVLVLDFRVGALGLKM